jgi:hypothetical protein
LRNNYPLFISYIVRACDRMNVTDYLPQDQIKNTMNRQTISYVLINRLERLNCLN